MTTFKQVGLSENILKALSELGFEQPTAIQEKAIPKLLEGYSDFIGLAQTGTGKTAAFGLPLLEHVDAQDNSTQALILAPTRELGQQIAEQIEKYSKYLRKINVLAVYGGAPISNQMRALRRPQHVIIATPGRLIDLIKRKSVKLNQLKFLVLDEADEMLNMGFKEELDQILSYTPEEKLTWLFSATMPYEIKRMVNTYMDNPAEVKIDRKNTVNANIEHQFVLVKQVNKAEALTRFLDSNMDIFGVVFCRTKMDTRNLAEYLSRRNYKADALHGDLSQAQRDRVMRRFREKQLQVLIATDVAARGIDVNDITHVFHFNLPDTNAYYTHRSGRTARAGKEGTSIAFVHNREQSKIFSIERELKITFNRILVPTAKDIAKKRIEKWCLEIAEKEIINKIPFSLIEKAFTVFKDLSKEELIKRLLAVELDKLDLRGADLNLSASSKPDSRRGRNSSRSRPSNRRRHRGGNSKGRNRRRRY